MSYRIRVDNCSACKLISTLTCALLAPCSADYKYKHECELFLKIIEDPVLLQSNYPQRQRKGDAYCCRYPTTLLWFVLYE